MSGVTLPTRRRPPGPEVARGVVGYQGPDSHGDWSVESSTIKGTEFLNTYDFGIWKMSSLLSCLKTETTFLFTRFVLDF